MALKTRKKSASVHELLNTKFVTMPFDSIWYELFGRPEMRGCWIVWGESANGKTAFVLQLCKYLSRFGRVAYDSIEEGISESFKQACIREGMMDVNRRFTILNKESVQDLEIRLQKRQSPAIIVVDSVQYTDLNKITAKQLVDRNPSKLFIFVSHAQGKFPDGRTANAIRYNADIKIRVEGYRATVESRFGGDKKAHYTIWHQGADEYWNN